MLGREVEVKLNDNHTFFTGVLSCLDGNMNVLLINAKEIQKDIKLN
jgi:small nuclear ribonucleoprotein (snRNP)-like protein